MLLESLLAFCALVLDDDEDGLNEEVNDNHFKRGMKYNITWPDLPRRALTENLYELYRERANRVEVIGSWIA